MCGIAGLLDPSPSCQHTLSAMLDSIAHRGPDDAGSWIDDTGIALGHRRLSIIDLSPAGHQPMLSASNRFVLSFNGEIYNHAALRYELERTGLAPPWRGHSDTEVLLAGIEAWGINPTLERCNGMFALALWDRQQHALMLTRDRMGEKPLYFGWVGKSFVFASEMKALAHVPGWSARMHQAAIASFLGSGYIRGPQSAVIGIYRLPPGCVLTLTLDQLHKVHDWEQLSVHISRYWSLHSTAVNGLDAPLSQPESVVDTFETLLRDAVSLRMAADVPLGAFLSGGIDSSLVTALMQTQSARPVRTFSVGFDEHGYDEAPHARAVAAYLGTDHTELYVNADDALALVPTLAKTFDEPFADNSQIPTLLVSQLARQHVTVALSGDGGDELFAGYGRYFAILKLWRMIRLLPPALRRGVAPTLATMAAALRPIVKMAATANDLPQRLDRLSERIAAGDIDALRLSFIGGTGLSRLRRNGVAHDLDFCRPPPEMHDALRRLMYGDQLDYLPDDILHKVDRASMAHGLEARVPLLDHRVVEFSWRLPNPMLVDHGYGKQLLRRVLERYVPRAMIDRPKQGFAPPMDAWLRGPLRGWAESLLSHASLRELPMLDANGIRSLWHAHLDRRMDAGMALWSVLMLADWRQRFQATL
jgi:asparagine synthase (glutamine-hydrolysing)